MRSISAPSKVSKATERALSGINLATNEPAVAANSTEYTDITEITNTPLSRTAACGAQADV